MVYSKPELILFFILFLQNVLHYNLFEDQPHVASFKLVPRHEFIGDAINARMTRLLNCLLEWLANGFIIIYFVLQSEAVLRKRVRERMRETCQKRNTILDSVCISGFSEGITWAKMVIWKAALVKLTGISNRISLTHGSVVLKFLKSESCRKPFSAFIGGVGTRITS